MIRFLTLSAILGSWLALPAAAQFAATLQLAKRQHVIGEPVVVVVKITNHSGQVQTLQPSGRIPWLSFIVKTSNGTSVNIKSADMLGPVRIEPGQTMARQVDLSEHFILEQAGNFTAYAVIRPSNSQTEGSSTNKVFFEQRDGRLYWNQKVGNIGPSKTTREFRLLKFRTNETTLLYAQVEDSKTGQLIRTFPLGETLSIRNPQVSVDQAQQMHVLFLCTPSMWLHYAIDPHGNIADRTIHKRASVGDPALKTLPNGEILVTNSIIHDPVAIAKQRAKVHRITDRPTIPEGF